MAGRGRADRSRLAEDGVKKELIDTDVGLNVIAYFLIVHHFCDPIQNLLLGLSVIAQFTQLGEELLLLVRKDTISLLLQLTDGTVDLKQELINARGVHIRLACTLIGLQTFLEVVNLGITLFRLFPRRKEGLIEETALSPAMDERNQLFGINPFRTAAVLPQQLLNLPFLYLHPHLLLHSLAEVRATDEATCVKTPSLDGLGNVFPPLVHLPQLLLQTTLTVLRRVCVIKGVAKGMLLTGTCRSV